MRDRDLRRLLAKVRDLTAGQRAQLQSVLERPDSGASVRALIDGRPGGASPACPHCLAVGAVRNGQANGLQRYKCRGCGKTFNALSGTPMARLRHKDKWLAQAQALSQGLSVHEAARTLDVAPSTAFRWRHRFLAQAKASVPPNVARAAGVASPPPVEPQTITFLCWWCVTDPAPAPTSSWVAATRRSSSLCCSRCWHEMSSCAPMEVQHWLPRRTTSGSSTERST